MPWNNSKHTLYPNLPFLPGWRKGRWDAWCRRRATAWSIVVAFVITLQKTLVWVDAVVRINAGKEQSRLMGKICRRTCWSQITWRCFNQMTWASSNKWKDIHRPYMLISKQDQVMMWAIWSTTSRIVLILTLYAAVLLLPAAWTWPVHYGIINSLLLVAMPCWRSLDRGCRPQIIQTTAYTTACSKNQSHWTGGTSHSIGIQSCPKGSSLHEYLTIVGMLSNVYVMEWWSVEFFEQTNNVACRATTEPA